MTKDPKTGVASPWNPCPQRWIDGSVDNDLPMTRLAEMFNVNHFIVSQVNPHVIPFLAKEDERIALESQSDTTTSPGITYTMMKLAKAEVLHRMHVLAELGIFPNALSKARSVLNQKYSGDITIFPEISYTDFPRMLQNPTTEFIMHAMLSGERATWSKLSRIRNHCAVELALDDAVQQLRARVVFSPSQVDLRMNAFTGIVDGGSGQTEESDGGKQRRARQSLTRTSDPTHQKPSRSQFDPNPKTTTERNGPSKSNKPRNTGPPSFSHSLTLPNSLHHTSSGSTSPVSPSSNTSPSSSDLDDTDQCRGANSCASSITTTTATDPLYFVHRPGVTGATAKAKGLFPHASQPCTPAIGQ